MHRVMQADGQFLILRGEKRNTLMYHSPGNGGYSDLPPYRGCKCYRVATT